MSSEQTGLSGKTRFAAWWLIVIGVIATIIGIALIPINLSAGYGEDSPIPAPVAVAIFVLSLILPGVLNIIAGIMLFKRKPRARTLAVALLSVECIFLMFSAVSVPLAQGPFIALPFILALVLYLAPLLLLILDQRKTKTD